MLDRLVADLGSAKKNVVLEHMERGNRLVELTNLLLQNPSQPAVAQLLRWVVPAGVCASGSTCGSMWQRAHTQVNPLSLQASLHVAAPALL